MRLEFDSNIVVSSFVARLWMLTFKGEDYDDDDSKVAALLHALFIVSARVGSSIFFLHEKEVILVEIRYLFAKPPGHQPHKKELFSPSFFPF